MSWDEDDDRAEHPSWCFCGECGGGDSRVASHDEPGTVFAGDSELSATVDETVAFIKKMVRDTTRTVFQVYRPLNHFNKEGSTEQMAFNVNSGGGGGGQSSARGQRSKGLPFLDPQKDLGADKRRIKILWAGDPKEANVHASWAVVTLKLQSVNSGARRLWTLGASNPSLDILTKEFGNDAHEWNNRELWMWCDANNPSETPFVRIEAIPLDATTQAAAAAPAGAGM